MKTTINSRPDFIKKSTGASAALVVGDVLPQYNALSYGRIMGSNQRIRVTTIGVNSMLKYTN